MGLGNSKVGDQVAVKKLLRARNQALSYYIFQTHSFGTTNKFPNQADRLKIYNSIVKDAGKFCSSSSSSAPSASSGSDGEEQQHPDVTSLSNEEVEVVAQLMDDALQLADWRLEYNLLDSTKKKSSSESPSWEGMSPMVRGRVDVKTGNIIPLEQRFRTEGEGPSSTSPPGHFSWLAFGDHGGPWNDELRQFAKRVDQVAGDINADMVLCLGDNFYQNGVSGVDDLQWQQFTKCFLEPNVHLQSIPWKVALGNHDHGLYQRGCPEAQIDYSEKCPGGTFVGKGINYRKCWQMPSNKYSFSVPIMPQQQGGSERGKSPSSPLEIAFICFDTNSCQFHVRSSHPERWAEWKQDLAWLDAELTKHADATWKVFYSHHPLYTRGHVNEARCLRTELGKTYPPFPPKEDGREFPGMGLQPLLRQHGVDVCFAGHDHVMSMYRDEVCDDECATTKTSSTSATVGDENKKNEPRKRSMLNIVSGAVTEFGYHKVVCKEEPMDYQGSQVGTGFAVGEAVAFYDGEDGAREEFVTTRLRVRFVSSDPIDRHAGPLYEDTLEKRIRGKRSTDPLQ